MEQMARDLVAFGDRRGADITALLAEQWHYRVQAIKRDTCQVCGGFKITCKGDARCTCAASKKKEKTA